MQGLIDIFHVAAVLLAIGAVSAAMLLRTGDPHHNQAAQQPGQADAQAPAAEPRAV